MKYLIALLALTLIGCETATNYMNRPDFSLISMGMPQDRVILALGKPEDMSAKDGVVYLKYAYAPWYDHNGADGNKEYYFVRLIDNKVESYGKLGDFDTTQTPTIRIEKDQTIRVQKIE